MAHWADRYIGLPWAHDGEGPEAFNCWTFVRHVSAERFGVALPIVPYPDNDRELPGLLACHPERGRWDEVAAPANGDLVLMRQSRWPVHIGIWLAEARGVLHCARRAGVVFQQVHGLRLNGWSIDGFYRLSEGVVDAGAR